MKFVTFAMLDALIDVHSRTCGLVYTRKASLDHLPKILILSTEWSIRNKAIAVIDLIDLVPMSEGPNLNLSFPPACLQVLCRKSLMFSELMSNQKLPSYPPKELISWSTSRFPSLLIFCLTALLQAMTGQRDWWPHQSWVRLFIFFPFFWSQNAIVTKWAFFKRLRLLCLITLSFGSLKTMWSKEILFVRPLVWVLENSHALIAKKKAPTIRLSMYSACLPGIWTSLELPLQILVWWWLVGLEEDLSPQRLGRGLVAGGSKTIDQRSLPWCAGDFSGYASRTLHPKSLRHFWESTIPCLSYACQEGSPADRTLLLWVWQRNT